MREILVNLGDWSIARYTFSDTSIVVYGEHILNCKYVRNINDDLDAAHWGWEYQDKGNVCWECGGGEVPEAVMGLVLLYNFDKVGR